MPTTSASKSKKRKFVIGIAGWSFHRMVHSGEKSALDLFQLTREEFGLSWLDLTSGILAPPNLATIDQLCAKSRKYRVKVRNVLVGDEGDLGSPDSNERARAVRHSLKWIYITADLGGRGVRLNWNGEERGCLGDEKKRKEHIKRSADSFNAILEVAKQHGIEIMIENHWGASSHPHMVAALCRKVNSPLFGTLPDFGNFYKHTNKYEGIDIMMPWAKTVSAKCYDFKRDGNELTIDFERMMNIVCDQHGYDDYVHIEYEGPKYAKKRVKPLSEIDGIHACLNLLNKLR
jgi:L-ribulose-5-phosphate 3-epimerase